MLIIIITVTVRSSGKLSHEIVNNSDNLRSRRKLLIHMEKARDHGYLDVDCAAVDYDYNDYIQQCGN